MRSCACGAVASAVTGVIAATAVQLLWSTAHRAPSLWGAGLLFLVALIAALFAKGRWAPPVLVVSGAVGGRLLFG